MADEDVKYFSNRSPAIQDSSRGSVSCGSFAPHGKLLFHYRPEQSGRSRTGSCLHKNGKRVVMAC